MCASAAVGDGATLQPSVDHQRNLVKLPGRRFWTNAPEFSGRRRMHGSMQNVAPVINQVHRGGMLRLAFLSAVVSLVVSFAAAAVPIPLYNIYRAEDGFTNPGISMAVVAYAAGTIAALLVLGRLSNHLGRRLTAIASLGLLLLEWRGRTATRCRDSSGQSGRESQRPGCVRSTRQKAQP